MKIMKTMSLKEIYLAGIEATEAERIAAGGPPDTDWIRAKCGLPVKYPDLPAPVPPVVKVEVVKMEMPKSEPVITTVNFTEVMERVPVVLVPKERGSKDVSVVSKIVTDNSTLSIMKHDGRGRPKKNGELSRTTQWRRLKGL
jgi:hypothetical protein